MEEDCEKTDELSCGAVTLCFRAGTVWDKCLGPWCGGNDSAWQHISPSATKAEPSVVGIVASPGKVSSSSLGGHLVAILLSNTTAAVLARMRCEKSSRLVQLLSKESFFDLPNVKI